MHIDVIFLPSEFERLSDKFLSGRPCQYPETPTLTLALLCVRDHASWRQQRYARAPEVLPTRHLLALSTRIYRLHTFLTNTGNNA